LADGLQDAMPDTFDEAVFEEYFGLVQDEELIVIRSYSGDDDDRLLEELRPKYIIMYDPDPSFIRRIECYKNLHAGLAMRVYFLVYQNSVEEQRFLASVRREKEAFERIINERKVRLLLRFASLLNLHRTWLLPSRQNVDRANAQKKRTCERSRPEKAEGPRLYALISLQ
jgi:hypothetical protein